MEVNFVFNDDYTVHRPADFDYNAAIAELEEQVRRKKHVTGQLTHFQAEVGRLSRLEESRRQELALENADVAKLQRISPALILYTLTGKKAEMLAREEAEALAAAARYETVKRDLEYAESRVQTLSLELRKLGNCERKLDEMVEEKKQKMLAGDTAFAEEVARLERAVKAVDREIREVDQALDKGSRVRGIIRSICGQLDKAEELSRVDTHFGRYPGSMLLDAEKHEHLDTAQAMLETLGQYLQDFAAELEDVELDERDIPDRIGVGEGTRALDLFFDNIFADFAVRRRISGSLTEMERLLEQVEPVLERLMEVKGAKAAKRELAENELKQFIQSH
jgi:hypothetical protein